MTGRKITPHLLLGEQRYDFVTVAPPEFYRAYYEALGRLMHAFAEAEGQLGHFLASVMEHLLDAKLTLPTKDEEGNLTRRGRSPNELLMAICAGMRAAPLKDAYKRVLRVAGGSPDFMKEVDRIFNQLGEIQFLRDRLAHNKADVDLTNLEGHMSASNYQTAREPDQWENIRFPMEALVDAAEDLSHIPGMLYAAIMTEFPLSGKLISPSPTHGDINPLS